MSHKILSRDSLYVYQRRAVEFIKNSPRCALFVDCGLGKTVSTLTAFSDLLYSHDARRMLVVAPLRVARDVWDAEIRSWSHLHGLTISKIVGTRQERIDALRIPADVHTINRENLAWLVSGYLEEVAPKRFKQVRQWGWDFLVLDESQSMKNQSSHRAVAASRLSTFGLAERIVELTGTPAPNGYADLWSQMFILDHGRRLGRSQDAFRKRWMDPPPDWGFKWTLKPQAATEIQRLISDITLSLQASDYLDLPPVLYNEIGISLPPAKMAQYLKLQRTAVLELGAGTVTAANAGVLGQKLLQLAAGAMYVGRRGEYETLHDAKLDALCEALDELAFSGPVLVAYGFRSDLERIGKRLDRYCGKAQTWSQLRSAEEMKRFAKGEIDFGVLHPASAGHGLNDLHFSGSENIIWFEPTINLEWWEQLNARIAGGHRRIGKNVRIQVLIAKGTVDEDYMAMTRRKNIDQVELVKALRARL